MAKNCTSVFLACGFLFARSDTFAVEPVVYRLAAKRTGKKQVEENANVSVVRRTISVH